MDISGIYKSEHFKLGKIYLTISHSESERIRSIWGPTKPPIYGDRIIINVSEKKDISPYLDRLMVYHTKVQHYTTKEYNGKKLVFLSADPYY